MRFYRFKTWKGYVLFVYKVGPVTDSDSRNGGRELLSKQKQPTNPLGKLYTFTTLLCSKNIK